MEILKSQLNDTRIRYLRKTDKHMSAGVDIVNQQLKLKLLEEYQDGEQCGKLNSDAMI
jgi:hypothetical protein